MDSTDLGRLRLLAWLIDLLMLIGFSALFGPPGWLVSAGYILGRDGLFDGQSIGKRIMGLKVVAHHPPVRCTYLDSLVRNMLWLVPVVNVVMGFTGLNALLHEPRGRHWGDLLANTQVVRA